MAFYHLALISAPDSYLITSENMSFNYNIESGNHTLESVLNLNIIFIYFIYNPP